MWCGVVWKAGRVSPTWSKGSKFHYRPPVGWESWGYLNSKTYTCDTWIHRIDISQATGRTLEPSADHDGLIVADLVHDWSKGKRPGLILTGQAGGIFGCGNGPSYDAIDFARAIAGRGTLEGITPDASLFQT